MRQKIVCVSPSPYRSIAFLAKVACLVFVALPRLAFADFWSDAAKVITAPQRVPIETTINILRRDDPSEPIQGTLQSAGRVVQQGSVEFQRAHDRFLSVPRGAIESTLGTDWVRAYDTLTASQRVQFELATTSGRFLGGCLRGQPCNLQQLTAAPLAAAMRDAYKVYAVHSSPLHPETLRVLSYVVPPHVLNGARIVVGRTPDLTVPGMLNAGYKISQHSHAVTLGNVMIFSRHLNFSDRRDWNWLLHEMFHIEQYMSYSGDVLESIDGFAVDYVGHSNSMERNAQRVADERQVFLEQRCRFGC